MLKFKNYLSEAVATASLTKVTNLVVKYFIRKLSTGVFANGEIEQYKNSKGAGYGIRLFFPKKKLSSLRFNWKSLGSASMANLSSIDIWDGTTQGPKYHISFDSDVSLVQVLPQLLDIFKKDKIQTGDFNTLAAGVSLNEALDDPELVLLAENLNINDAFDGVLSQISAPNFNKGKVYKAYKSTGLKILDAIVERYPNAIALQGRSYVWQGDDDDIAEIASNRDDIISSIGVVKGKIQSGSSSEKYRVDPKVEEIENNQERLAYDIQVKDLKNLVKQLYAGVSNALFVAGRGGIGKTYNVEETLAELGLSDGNGYFKNTGSASAAGIYSLLFKHRNEIVFFDDSDDALKDQQSRNIFKAATDTKKMRKLSWTKKGGNVVNPDDYDSDEDILDDGKIPEFFEFTGKIIFISNLSPDKLDPDGAIRTRAFLIDINPTEQEVYDFMEKIVENFPLNEGLTLDLKTRKEVVNILRESKSKQTANFRKLSRALNMMAGAILTGNVSDAEIRRMINFYA